MSDGIRYNDRTLVLGNTTSGKSELLNHLFTGLRCQRVLVDTKDEWTIPGVEPVSDPGAIDWSQPVIHFVDQAGDVDEFDRLFEAAGRRRGLVVCVHELSDLCDYAPNRTPRWVRAYLSKGAAHGRGLLGASQRPVEMPRRARTETQHVFAVVPRLDRDDLETVARMVNIPADELAAEMDRRHTELGDHAFLWFDRRSQRLTACRPLPESIRSRSLVKRRRAPA